MIPLKALTVYDGSSFPDLNATKDRFPFQSSLFNLAVTKHTVLNFGLFYFIALSAVLFSLSLDQYPSYLFALLSTLKLHDSVVKAFKWPCYTIRHMQGQLN